MMFWNKSSGILLLVFMAIFIPSTAIADVKQNSTDPEHQNCSDIAKNKNARLLEADVVAIDHPIIFNRLGAQNVNWMMYALRHDVVFFEKKSKENADENRILIPFSYEEGSESEEVFKKIKKSKFEAWRERKTESDDSYGIALRPDLRPRPLVLRVAAGDYLEVRFTNLLHHKLKHYGDAPPNFANPFDYPDPLGIKHPQEHNPENQLELVDPETNKKRPLTLSEKHKIYTSDDQAASRVVGFHPQGLELVTGIDDDSSFVGKNKNNKNNSNNRSSMAAPGETKTYCFYAPEEGSYMVSSDGAVFGGEGTAGNSGVGLFGAVTVQPSSEKYKNGTDIDQKWITHFYRAQVTEEELRLATRKDEEGNFLKTPTGQPIIDYEATYPNDCNSNGVWCKEGKAGKPILNMVWGNRIWHGDINALIIGPNDDGSFTADTYPLEKIGERNPTLPNRLEPFREFVSIFHDENAATQAFPYFFEHPELKHTLHGVRDSFMINYGSGGVGAEIIANRLQIGPMHDCLDCAYEEFFLSSFVVGDAAMLVDSPANLVTSQCQPEYVRMIKDPNDPRRIREIPDPKYSKERERFCTQKPEDRAAEAYYPHDPANVHHSYIGDFVKFRNMHSGKEQHIFHLHNHQWLFNPNDDNSNYIDAQGIGPGSGYTYEIAFGGSGNRNKTVGDAIFHCHYYPHFAQGMWYMWRNHDVFEAGTRLEVSEINEKGELNKDSIHTVPFALKSGKPSTKVRALPDGEIVAGAPIPAIVPLPGKGMAPMPLDVTVKPRIGDDGEIHGSMAEVTIPEATTVSSNPGYPFWVAGVSAIAGAGDNQVVSIGSRPTTPPLDMCNENNCKGIFNDPDMNTKDKVQHAKGHDGGLPRHALAGFSSDGKAHAKIDRFTAEKYIEVAKPILFPEEGTGLEKIAMNFHSIREHKTSQVDMHGTATDSKFIVNGASPVPGAPFNEPCIDDEGNLLERKKYGKFFGGNYTGEGEFIDVKDALPDGIEFGANYPRIYKGANIQLDVVFNKLGYHYPQQRILALWEDVGPLLDKMNPKAPEPLVMRLNTFDCAMYAHTNLAPAAFYADDYQITTPTDVIGQHIHLPKWDLTSADGGANGWNYEDGTFSPDMVRERIHAINKWYESSGIEGEKLTPKVHPYFNGSIGDGLQEQNCLQLWQDALKKSEEETKHACETNDTYRGKYKGNVAKCVREEDDGLYQFQVKYGKPGVCNWLGARTTLQRWFSDPIVNRQGIHRGLGTTFTHDHLGPSTHQQLGLYATMLSEPPGSEWRHNETGEKLYDTAKREDGGPTSWQAVITGKDGKCIDVDGDSKGDCAKKGDDSHREFFLQFGDFQHAYVKGAFYGVNRDGVGWIFDPKQAAKPTPDSFRFAINPSVRKPAKPVFPDILAFEPTCPGGKELVNKAPEEGGPLPGSVYGKNDFSNTEWYDAKGQPLRPCPEAISADDVGMMVVNYRNEPLGARVYDPERRGPDGKKGMQAKGKHGDLAFAMQTRDDRAISALNTKYGNTKYYPLTEGVLPGDPFTPMIRAYSGDRIKIKIQGGSHEHEHNASINALSWLQGGSGYGQAPHSGWRNSQNAGLSEQFTFQASVVDYESPTGMNDRMYTVDTSQDGLWNGVWGIIRTHNVKPPKEWELHTLPTNEFPTLLAPGIVKADSKPEKRLDNVCPADAPVSEYKVSAVLANRVLSKSLGVSISTWRSQSYRWWEWAWWQPTTRSQLNPNGGSLIYNPRSTEINLEILDEMGNVVGIQKYGNGPLHDPTAIMFVRDEDLDSNGYLKPSAPLEPLVLRAAAGDCIQIKLTNRLPFDPDHMPDLDGYTSVSGIIPRNCPELGKKSKGKDIDKDCYQTQVYNSSTSSFNNNLVRPSNHIALHTQMVSYDVQASDGNNVGINAESTVAPGMYRRYSWYAGKIEVPQDACEVEVDDTEKTYLTSFSYPYTNSLSSQFLSFENSDGFVDNILTQMNYRILDGYKPYYLEKKAMSREYTVDSIQDLYKAWRQAGTIDYDESFGISSGPLDLIGSSRNWMMAKLMRVVLTVDSVLFREDKKDCVQDILDFFKLNKIDEKRKDLVLFDRVKVLHVMNKLAECRGEPATIVKYQTKNDNKNVRLIHFGKAGETLPQGCKPEQMAHFVPIEYGSSNLTPPDRIKQGQKGAIGALVIEPEGAKFPDYDETNKVVDRQQNPKSAKINLRYTRTMADVIYKADGKERKFRDLVLVHQKGLNLRYKDGSAIPNIAAEKEMANENPAQTVPEDAHDSGHMAINYGTEPMWFRFGLPPDAPFGKPGLGGADSAWQAFSDECCSNGNGIGTVNDAVQPLNEPYVPIMKAYAGEEMRIRALMPTGTGRGSVVELHGHSWMRDPYLAEFVEPEGYPRGGNQFGFYDKEGDFHPGWGTPSKCIGENALAMHLGGQESLTPMAHFDMVFPRAGGKHGVSGDYLWRDHAGFGITNGLWALIRVEDAPKEYTDLHEEALFAPESLRTNCNFVVAGSNSTAQ